MLQVSGQVSRRAGPIRLQAEVVGRVMLDEADVEPSTELGVESHCDWEHLALFVFFHVFQTNWCSCKQQFQINFILFS